MSLFSNFPWIVHFVEFVFLLFQLLYLPPTFDQINAICIGRVLPLGNAVRIKFGLPSRERRGKNPEKILRCISFDNQREQFGFRCMGHTLIDLAPFRILSGWCRERIKLVGRIERTNICCGLGSLLFILIDPHSPHLSSPARPY